MTKDMFVRSVTVQGTTGAQFNGEIWRKGNGTPDDSTTRDQMIRLEDGRNLKPYGDRENEWEDEADVQSKFIEVRPEHSD